MICAPAILYTAEHIETRKQAVGAGLIAGAFAIFPGVAFHLAFMCRFPEITSKPLPTYWMIDQMDLPLLLFIYLFLLFGTIVQTGVGVLQGINERLDAWWKERSGRPMKAWVHAIVAFLAVVSSMILANAGIVALVAKGYGSAAWFSLVIYVLPVVTLGVWKLRRVS